MLSKTIVAKQTNSVFIGTGFAEMLRAAGHGVLAITGVITNNSVEATVRMAENLGFETYLVEAATRARWGHLYIHLQSPL